MHLISKIHIINFKSISDASFTFSKYTPLVGCNNAGKTNILKAIQWVVKKSSLIETDFFDKTKEVVVEATISGITVDVLAGVEETHRRRIKDYVLKETITIKRTQSEPNDKAASIKLQILKSDNTWADNPTGIDAAISALFPEPIFIGAMENSLDDLSKNTASSAIGNLIKEITEMVSAKYATEVESALIKVDQKLGADGSFRDKNLVEIDNQIQNEVDKFFNGISAKIHIPVLKFTDFLKSGTIKLKDTSLEGASSQDASSFGHGTQRTIQIALIKCLADIKKSGDDGSQGRTTLLLIDEPELYLHPQAIELVRHSLSALSSEGYQVVFTTHSPCMISRHDAVNTQIIRRVDGKTSALTSTKIAIEHEITDSATQSELLFEMGNASQILFSENVLLFEGKTERAVFPDLFQTVNGHTLESQKIGIVFMNGVYNIPNGLLILQAMGIAGKAVVDLDFAFKGAVTNGFIDKNHEAIKGCKKILSELANDGKLELDDRGLPKKGEGSSAAEGFALLAKQVGAEAHIKQIHNELRGNNIWLWQKGTIETHLELTNKSSTEHVRFVKTLQQDGYDWLKDFENIRDLCEWIEQTC